MLLHYQDMSFSGYYGCLQTPVHGKRMPHVKVSLELR